MKTRFITMILAVSVLSILIAGGNAFGDEKRGWYKKIMGKWGERHEEDERGEHGERGEKSRKGENKNYQFIVDNPVYKQECSSCHFLYQPFLLPASSWQKIMNESAKHFGENLSLDEKTANEILSYLTQNSADKSQHKRAYKIMNSIGSSSPTRVTEIPYIKGKHHEVDPKVYQRKSIGSFANCGACHTTADRGDYEERNIAIPK